MASEGKDTEEQSTSQAEGEEGPEQLAKFVSLGLSPEVLIITPPLSLE